MVPGYKNIPCIAVEKKSFSACWIGREFISMQYLRSDHMTVFTTSRKGSKTNHTKCNLWFISVSWDLLSINFLTTSTSFCFPASKPSESWAMILLFPSNSISFSILWEPLCMVVQLWTEIWVNFSYCCTRAIHLEVQHVVQSWYIWVSLTILPPHTWNKLVNLLGVARKSRGVYLAQNCCFSAARLPYDQ